MTQGIVVVLGDVGYNIGAGMTGGILYGFDENNTFEKRLNNSYVRTYGLTDEDIKKLRAIIENYYTYSGSCRAAEILADIEKSTNYFRKIAPFR